mgnify:CR=1 FL=1
MTDKAKLLGRVRMYDFALVTGTVFVPLARRPTTT